MLKVDDNFDGIDHCTIINGKQRTAKRQTHIHIWFQRLVHTL